MQVYVCVCLLLCAWGFLGVSACVGVCLCVYILFCRLFLVHAPFFKGVGGSPTKNDFFAFSDVLSGRLQKSVYRIKKSSFVLILWTVQISKSQGVPFVLETLKLNNS